MPERVCTTLLVYHDSPVFSVGRGTNAARFLNLSVFAGVSLRGGGRFVHASANRRGQEAAQLFSRVIWCGKWPRCPVPGMLVALARLDALGAGSTNRRYAEPFNRIQDEQLPDETLCRCTLRSDIYSSSTAVLQSLLNFCKKYSFPLTFVLHARIMTVHCNGTAMHLHRKGKPGASRGRKAEGLS